MAVQDRRCLLEPLEGRRYADGVPGPIISTPAVSYGPDGSVYIDGGVGNDAVTVRVVKHLIRIEVISKFNVNGLPSYGVSPLPTDPHNTRVDTDSASTGQDGSYAVFVQNFVLPQAGHRVIRFEGRRGHDSLRAAAMPINIVATQVEETAVTPQTAPAGATPSDPAPGALDGSAKAWADKLRRQLKAASTSRATTAFFGDSHADRYPFFGRRSWLAAFPHALNLGTGGDTSRNMLYRIDAGLFERFKPDTLVVMAGTNNLNSTATGGTTAQIYDGLAAVYAALRRRLPDTRLVALSVFPRAESGMKPRIEAINASLHSLAVRTGKFEFLNVYDRLADTLYEHDLVDRTNHLTAAGYRLVTRDLTALLKADNAAGNPIH